MRGALVAAVASALLLIVGPPAAYAVDGPAGQPAVVVEADATSVGRPVAPQPEAAPPVPAITAPAITVPAITVPAITVPAITVPAITVPAITVPAITAPALATPTTAARVSAAPAGAVDFVWLIPLAAGLAVLGVGWVLSRRNRHDDSD